MNKKEAIEHLNNKLNIAYFTAEDNEALDLAIIALEQRPTGEWIPVTTRDMTEEEVKELEASGLLDDFDIKDFYENPKSYWLYNCRLPDDGQEVLVSTKWGVKLVTFYSDIDYGNYFEEYEDRYDVDAWMPLPEAYKKGAEE